MMEAHDVTWYSHKSRYKEQVEAHLANLLSISMQREQVCAKGYEYALALQTDQQARGNHYVTATMMARAVKLVSEALPGAYRIYDLRNRMR